MSPSNPFTPDIFYDPERQIVMFHLRGILKTGRHAAYFSDLLRQAFTLAKKEFAHIAMPRNMRMSIVGCFETHDQDQFGMHHVSTPDADNAMFHVVHAAARAGIPPLAIVSLSKVWNYGSGVMVIFSGVNGIDDLKPIDPNPYLTRLGYAPIKFRKIHTLPHETQDHFEFEVPDPIPFGSGRQIVNPHGDSARATSPYESYKRHIHRQCRERAEEQGFPWPPRTRNGAYLPLHVRVWIRLADHVGGHLGLIHGHHYEYLKPLCDGMKGSDWDDRAIAKLSCGGGIERHTPLLSVHVGIIRGPEDLAFPDTVPWLKQSMARHGKDISRSPFGEDFSYSPPLPKPPTQTPHLMEAHL